MDLIDMKEMKYYGKALAINFKKFLDRTVDRYNNMFTLNPEESKEILLEIGKDLEQKGDFKGAGEIYKKIIASEPNNVNALFKLGTMYFNAGQFNEAREVLKKVVLLDNTYPQVFYLLGSAHFASMKTKRPWRPSKKPWNSIPAMPRRITRSASSMMPGPSMTRPLRPI